MTDPEGELLRRACAGDEGAFLAVYERHRRPLFRFAYRMLGSAAPAEDMVHECFLALLTHPTRFDPGRASLRTFLCAIARNLAFKQLRRRGVETSSEDLAVEPGPEPDAAAGPLQQLLEGERSAAVQEAVSRLPPLQREVVILFEYEGMSLAEIAQVVETDTGTVKSRLHRARERLRRTLGPWISGGTVPEAGAGGGQAPLAERAAPRRRTMERLV